MCPDNRPPVFTFQNPCDPARYQSAPGSTGNAGGSNFFGDIFSNIGGILGEFDFSQAYNNPVTHCYLAYPPFSGKAAERAQCIAAATGATTAPAAQQNKLAGYGLLAGIGLVLVYAATRKK